MTYKTYHAHVYYNVESRPEAGVLRETLADRFKVNLGRWRDQAVGPHPTSMYQVAFTADQFPQVVPFLMENHGALSVLIHPNTGDDLGDHADRALWVGTQLELNLDSLRNHDES